MKKIFKQVASLFTDREWDADITKIAGVAIVAMGLYGWWLGKAEFQWVVGFGAAMVTSGKFTKEG